MSVVAILAGFFVFVMAGVVGAGYLFFNRVEKPEGG